MRKWYYIFLLFLPLLACHREWEQESGEEGPDPEGEVTVVFSVPVDEIPTKALGENPGLVSMHLAVFGSSGYLKQYVPATLLKAAAPRDSLNGDIIMPCYTFSASIALSNSPRRIHFIGNGPSTIHFGRDYDVLPVLMGEKETGFWQVRVVPGIYAKQDSNGDYITPDLVNGGYKKRNKNASTEEEPYVVSDETLKYFQNVPLIRNWAKIIINAETGSHFTPKSFAVVNRPKRGTLVPYGGTKGFITNYKDLTFDELTGEDYDYNYQGNLPDTVEFLTETPAAELFEQPDGVTVKAYDPNNTDPNKAPAVYLYERPVPNAELQPSFVIIYGHYRNEDDPVDPNDSHDPQWRTTEGDYYYKVDLMNNGKYYPILRNFKYEIQIHRISAPGQLTPELAAKGAGSADVSADINASHLPDISDGKRRMAIDGWMSKTFITAQDKKDWIYVKFLDDVTKGNEPNMNPASVTYKLIPDNADIIRSVSIGAPRSDAQKEEDNGWRPVSFAVAGPHEVSSRTQTLRIICKTNPNDGNEKPLYRDIVISVLPTQTMRVKCATERVLQVSGEEVKVDVSLPDGLMPSMFPLYFQIEALGRTLTPDNSLADNNMPVIAGESLSGNGKPSFSYQRTVTWAEYKSLVPKLDFNDDSRWRTFSSYFKTNCANSATDVYVANEFFYTGQDSFENYLSFRDPKFTTSIPCRVGATINMTAQMVQAQSSYDRVYLSLKNLEPANGSGILKDDKGRYYYDPLTKDLSFDFSTTTDDGDIIVTLSTGGSYEPATLKPYRFESAGVMDFPRPGSWGDAAVAFGHITNATGNNVQVLWGYYDDKDDLKARVSSSQKYPRVDFINPAGLGTGTWYLQPKGPVTDTGVENFHEKWMNTTTTNTPISLTFSSAGYVEVTESVNRFSGSIIKADKTVSSGFQSWTQTTSNIEFRASFNTTLSYNSTLKGLVLERGNTYTLDVEAKPKTGYTGYLYFVGIFYAPKGATPYIPADVETEDQESVYFCYPGNNYEYGWRFPYGVNSGRITLKAPANQDAVITRIYIKAFRGTFLDKDGNPTETP